MHDASRSGAGERLRALIAALPAYWFRGPQGRFARDAGVSESTFCRILSGTLPRYADACRIVARLEEALGRRLNPREVFGGAAGGTPLAPLPLPRYDAPEEGGVRVRGSGAGAASAEAMAKVRAHWRREIRAVISEADARRLIRQSQECLRALAE